jgi:iron(III) transport system ATP-binding protein
VELLDIHPRRGAREAAVTPALRCRGVEKAFKGVPVVRGVDLDVGPGSFTALLGPSGCGKTTTLRIVAGFETADTGTVELGGRLVAGPGVCVPPERRRVGMVFQEGALFAHLSVARNVAFGLGRGSEAREAVERALALVGLTGFEERMPHELSGGQQQRVALARALAPRPDLILLDEPFANLDAELRVQVRLEVRAILREVEATAVLVTHDQEEALSLADRVAVMLDGRIVQEASPEELYHRPASREVARFVGDAQFMPGVAMGRRVRTELGELPLVSEASGEVDVLIRPERIRLSPPREGQPANAVVEDRLFFGHDQLLRIRLVSGTTVNVRLGAYGGIRAGHLIHVAVKGAVLAFPRATASS